MNADYEAFEFVVEYFETGALIFFPFDARMIRINETAAELLRPLLAGRSEVAIGIELQDRHGIDAREAREMIAFIRDQLERFGLKWPCISTKCENLPTEESK